MVLDCTSFKISSFNISDIGLVRENNEDICKIDDKRGLYILADGMGGHNAGEVAASCAVDHLYEYYLQKIEEDCPDSLENYQNCLEWAFQQANRTVYKMSRTHHTLQGMGTTLCLGHLIGSHFLYGHIGDSRIYRFRNGRLTPLTQDHSLLKEMVDVGDLEQDRGYDFLYRNVLTKAVGTNQQIKPSLSITPIKPNDLYLFCSDGLTDLLCDLEIEKILNFWKEKEKWLKYSTISLVEAAKERGGYDNITLVTLLLGTL